MSKEDDWDYLADNNWAIEHLKTAYSKLKETPIKAQLFKVIIDRFSGTEPIMRMYCETMHEDKVKAILDDGLKVAGIK